MNRTRTRTIGPLFGCICVSLLLASTLRPARRPAATGVDHDQPARRQRGPAVATLGTPAGAGKRSYAREGDTVAVLTWAVSVQSDRYLKVTVDNQTAERIELKNAWIREGKRYSEEAVFVPAPGTKTTQDRIAVVPPYGQVTGMVLVPDHVKTPLDELNSARPPCRHSSPHRS